MKIRAAHIRSNASPPEAWWASPLVVCLVVLAAAAPLAYPPIPPLVDLFGHMGRYRVELGLGSSPFLARYYELRWPAIGNFGVDVLVVSLAPLLGLELAVKLVVLAIPPLTVAGFLWVSREVHGKISPTAYFAVPFAYSHPFFFGFVNFNLSIALAFLAFALWLRLAKSGRLWLRAFLFLPASLIVFFAHVYGWGMLGLLCFSAEAVRQHDRGQGWIRSAFVAASQCLSMALPLLIILAWGSGDQAKSNGDWFNWSAKLGWIATALRDRWRWFDLASVAVAFCVLVEALRNSRLVFSRNLAFSGLVLIGGFLLMPRIVFGSAYADMRLVPYIFVTFLLAIKYRGPIDRRLAGALATAALAFCSVRLTANAASLKIASDDQQAKLAAIRYIPEGARVISLVGASCVPAWALPRDNHLGAMVLVRRDGFSNDQWPPEWGNSLIAIYQPGKGFGNDPSQQVKPDGCPGTMHRSISQALVEFPRDEFDYLWLIDPPAFDEALISRAKPIWRGRNSTLYRLARLNLSSTRPALRPDMDN